MNTTKYEINLPTLPDGWEIVGQGISQAGDMAMRYTTNDGWHWCTVYEGSPFNIIARRKRTLADWANEQPLFKALAEIMKDYESHKMCVETQGSLHGQWTLSEPLNYPRLGVPPCHGKLTLENGKWEDMQ